MTKRICNTLKWLFCGFQQMSFIRRRVGRVKLEVIDEKSLKNIVNKILHPTTPTKICYGRKESKITRKKFIKDAKQKP